MPTVSHHIDLPCDADRAWAQVVDPDRMVGWMGGLHAVEWGRLPPDEVGRTFVVDRTVGGQRNRHPAEVIAWAPGRTLGWRILQDQLTVDRITELSPHDGGTRVTVTLSLHAETLIARLGLPLFLAEARQRLHRELAGLSRLVDDPTPVSRAQSGA